MKHSEVKFDDIACDPRILITREATDFSINKNYTIRSPNRRLYILIFEWLTPIELRKKISATSLLFYKLTWSREVLIQSLSIDKILGF